MKKIFFGTREMIVPSRWNELKKEDLLYFSKLMSSNYTKEEIVVALTSYFSKMSIAELRKYNPLIFSKIEHQFDFLFREVKLRKQLIPKIRLGFRVYEGAEEGLADFTFERFVIFAESYFDAFLREGKEEYLDKLIATIYVRAGKEWSGEETEKNYRRFSKLSKEYKTAILYFYEGNRNYIASRFPRLFRKGKKKDEKATFLDVLELLNSGDVSKNNEIKKINVYEAMKRLENMVIETEKSKKQ